MSIKKYSQESKDKISLIVLNGMSNEGLSCFKACQKAGVPNGTFMLWLDVDKDLAERYARARHDLIERIAADMLDITDQDVGLTLDGKKDWMAVQKQRLQVDTRKWLLSKLAPKKYGDKLELTGDPERPLSIQRIERIIVDVPKNSDQTV
jgi:hypothetical protein